MRYLLVILLAASLHAQEPDAPSQYPHAFFAFEAGALAGAIFEDARGYGASEYYRNGIEQRHSVGKFSAINVPIGIAATLGGYKLQTSRHKPLRILGHIVMCGALAGYSIDYFSR